MPDKHVYLPVGLFEKVKDMDRGEFSQICQKAVQEYFNIRKKTPEEIKCKLREIEYEEQRKEKEKEILNKQLEEVQSEEWEKERKEQEKKQKQEQEIKFRRNFNNNLFLDELGREAIPEELDEIENNKLNPYAYVDKLKNKTQ